MNYPKLINFYSELDTIDNDIENLMIDAKNDPNETQFYPFYVMLKQHCEQYALEIVTKYYNNTCSNNDFDRDQLNFSCHTLSSLLIIRFIILQMDHNNPNFAIYIHKYGQSFSAGFAHIISANIAELIYELTKWIPFSERISILSQYVSARVLLLVYKFISEIIRLITSPPFVPLAVTKFLYIYFFNILVIITMFTIRFIILFNNSILYLFFGRRSPIAWAKYIIGDLGTHILRYEFTVTTNPSTRTTFFGLNDDAFDLEVSSQARIFAVNCP
jgi:hypothetical protein